MDFTAWFEILKTFGFPIAMCVAMMYWIYRREERESKSQIARECRMAKRLDQVSDQTLSIMQSVVAENTQSLRGMANELRAMREHCMQTTAGD
jgi:hypothetical protein